MGVNDIIGSEFFKSLFPFHFVLDNSQNVKSAGASLLKLFPKIRNSRFKEVFVVKRPWIPGIGDVDPIGLANQLIVIESIESHLTFKGQFIPLENATSVFVGTLWVTDPDDLLKFGLTLSDYPFYDSMPDMLQVLKMKEYVTNDVKELAVSLDHRKKELEKSEIILRSTTSRLTTLIQNLHAGILVEDEDRKIVLVNQKFCEIFKIPITPDSMIGMDCAGSAEQSKGLFKDPKTFVDELEVILRNRTSVLGQQLEMVDNTILERDYVPIFIDDRYVGHMWQYRDVTEKVQMFNELIQAKEEAIESGKSKEQFLANMSHEIRTPLNAIIGMSSLLLDTKINEEQKECIDAIKISSENLLEIINDILDFSKIGSNKVEFEKIPFKLEQVVEEVIQTLQFSAHKKKIGIRFSIDANVPPVLIGDKTRLRQILLNLASNSIKFTDKGFVTIHVASEAEVDQINTIVFSVSDTGIGIPSDKLTTIFKAFTQASNDTNRKYGGTGLGLPIAKELTELQGGSMSVLSMLNKGSTFTFKIPYKTGSLDFEETKLNRITTDLKFFDKRKVLLVEDNIMNQLLAKKILKKWGVEVDSAENGLVALDKLNEKNYDLILMDIQMPLKDGYETTKEIRQKDWEKRNIPIIAMTANALVGEYQKCLDVGMNDCIFKPFQVSDLFEMLRKYWLVEPISNVDVLSSAPFNETEPKKVVDLTYMQSVCDNDVAFIYEMLDSYLIQTPEILNNISLGLNSNNLAIVKSAVHKFKPSVIMLGMKSLEENVNFINETDQKNLDENVIALSNEIIKIVTRSLEEVKLIRERNLC